jgi:hypothetical protein
MSFPPKKFYFIAMSQKDLFKNQVLEEILRERKTFYTTKKQDIDFWILISPSFLNSTIYKEKFLETNYYKQLNLKLEKSSIESFSCIISMNKEFLDWIKLRLGFFDNLTLNKEAKNKDFSSKVYQSNGIFDELEYFREDNCSLLKNNNLNLDKDFLINKLSRILDNIKTS